jgi:hypothetical protein
LGVLTAQTWTKTHVIRDEGHALSLRKTPKWSITGYAYWASSNVAPAGIHVPSLPLKIEASLRDIVRAKCQELEAKNFNYPSNAKVTWRIYDDD